MAETNGRPDVYRTVVAAILSAAFAGWGGVIYFVSDRVLEVQKEIQATNRGIEQRLDVLEKEQALVGRAITDLPPKWLVDRIERVEREQARRIDKERER